MYTIRKGVKEDCVAIDGLIRELAAYEKLSNEPQLGPNRLEEDGFGCDPLFYTFVAELNESQRIIGYVLYFNKYSTWKGRGFWMEDLYVQPQYRGNGIGLALFKAVVKHTAQLSCDRLEWNCLDWNQNSLDFYEKLGGINLTALEGWQTFRLNRDQIEKLSQCDQCDTQ